MEDFKIKYKFLHCKNPKSIIEKLYPNEFKNANYANNRMKYMSFLDRVEKDKRWNELAMELGLTNCQTSNKEKAKVVDITKNEPHKASEVICTNCKYRWIAVRPIDTLLKDLECPKCEQLGFVIETGEHITNE